MQTSVTVTDTFSGPRQEKRIKVIFLTDLLVDSECNAGMFENDLPHGKGARYYPSGEVYMGGWLNGEKHGVGVLEGPQEESDEQENQTKDQEGAPASMGMKKVKSHACIDGLPLDVVDLRSSVRSLSVMFSSLVLTVVVRMTTNPRKERMTIWSMQNGRMQMIKRTSMLSDGDLEIPAGVR